MRGLTIQMQADGRKPLVLSSSLSAAADLSRWAASYPGRDVVRGYLFTAIVSLTSAASQLEIRVSALHLSGAEKS
jgi:hypothetical protein